MNYEIVIGIRLKKIPDIEHGHLLLSGQFFKFGLQFIKHPHIAGLEISVDIARNYLQHIIVSIAHIPTEQAQMVCQFRTHVYDG